MCCVKRGKHVSGTLTLVSAKTVTDLKSRDTNNANALKVLRSAGDSGTAQQAGG